MLEITVTHDTHFPYLLLRNSWIPGSRFRGEIRLPYKVFSSSKVPSLPLELTDFLQAITQCSFRETPRGTREGRVLGRAPSGKRQGGGRMGWETVRDDREEPMTLSLSSVCMYVCTCWIYMCECIYAHTYVVVCASKCSHPWSLEEDIRSLGAGLRRRIWKAVDQNVVNWTSQVFCKGSIFNYLVNSLWPLKPRFQTLAIFNSWM